MRRSCGRLFISSCTACRESLTIAGQIGQRIEVVNAALERLQDECEDCITVARPYANEPRIVVTVVRWEALKRSAG